MLFSARRWGVSLLYPRSRRDTFDPLRAHSSFCSFGVIVWDVLCGNGELPWAHLNATQLLLKLRRGEHLMIPAECDQFYRYLPIGLE